jgi:hypothetical protein
MRDDELERQLGPAVQSISAAHGGSGWRASGAAARPAERPVGDDGDAALARQRQQALLGLAVEQVVGELHEVERLAGHDLLELAWRRPSEVVMPT